ncbi:ATP-binding region, ATPase-like domain protein, partial [mine drainage metagenome]
EITAASSGPSEFALSVRDDGIGIPAGDLPRLFADFEQVERAPNASSPGTGLGLSIVRKFVVLMGGTVDVQSVVGHGSTFTVHLPLVDHPDVAGEAPSVGST